MIGDMSQTEWLDPTEMRLWRAFLASSSSVTSTLDSELKASTGISMDDYEMLVHLSEAPDERLRMSELSTMLMHSKSRLTQRVDRLVVKGWVERVKCDEDARGTWAALTKDGMTAIKNAAPQHLQHVRENFIDHFTPEERNVVMAALERIADIARD